MRDFVGLLGVAVIGTAVFAFAIWVVRSVLRDMEERGSPRWSRVLWFVFSLVPPWPFWGLAYFAYDEKRHPPGPDLGSGWMGASRRLGRRLRRQDRRPARPR